MRTKGHGWNSSYDYQYYLQQSFLLCLSILICKTVYWAKLAALLSELFRHMIFLIRKVANFHYCILIIIVIQMTLEVIPCYKCIAYYLLSEVSSFSIWILSSYNFPNQKSSYLAILYSNHNTVWTLLHNQKNQSFLAMYAANCHHRH